MESAVEKQALSVGYPIPAPPSDDSYEQDPQVRGPAIAWPARVVGIGEDPASGQMDQKVDQFMADLFHVCRNGI